MSDSFNHTHEPGTLRSKLLNANTDPSHWTRHYASAFHTNVKRPFRVLPFSKFWSGRPTPLVVDCLASKGNTCLVFLNKALPVRKSNRESATFRSLNRRSINGGVAAIYRIEKTRKRLVTLVINVLDEAL